MQVGDKRFVRNVAPGSGTDGFLPQGLGSGYEIPDSAAIDKQKAKKPIAPGDGSKTAAEVMQERFKAIQPTAPNKAPPS